MRRILDVCLQTFRPYAEQHTYDLVVGEGDSAGRPPAWAKVLLVRRLLNAYDEVLWLDADTMILDGTMDIAEQLSPSDYQGLVRHEQPDGSDYPNTGVWLLRGSRGRDLLDAMWACEEYIGHQWWDNAAFMHLMGYELDSGRVVRESPWTNGTRWLDATWNGHTGFVGLAPVRIRHYAGVDNETRLRNMHLDLREIQAAKRERQGLGEPVARPEREPWVQKWTTREERERSQAPAASS